MSPLGQTPKCPSVLDNNQIQEIIDDNPPVRGFLYNTEGMRATLLEEKFWTFGNS